MGFVLFLLYIVECSFALLKQQRGRFVSAPFRGFPLRKTLNLIDHKIRQNRLMQLEALRLFKHTRNNCEKHTNLLGTLTPKAFSRDKPSIQNQYSWSEKSDSRYVSLAWDEKSREGAPLCRKTEPRAVQSNKLKLQILAALVWSGVTSPTVTTSLSDARCAVVLLSGGHSEMTFALLPAYWFKRAAPSNPGETGQSAAQWSDAPVEFNSRFNNGELK